MNCNIHYLLTNQNKNLFQIPSKYCNWLTVCFLVRVTSLHPNAVPIYAYFKRSDCRLMTNNCIWHICQFHFLLTNFVIDHAVIWYNIIPADSLFRYTAIEKTYFVNTLANIVKYLHANWVSLSNKQKNILFNLLTMTFLFTQSFLPKHRNRKINLTANIMS
jgi:hypothetical protein